MTSDVIIKISNADIGYRVRPGNYVLLKDLGSEVRRSELVALIGKNGSGKTTLLKSIIRLQELLSGTIYIEGKDLGGYKSENLARKIGYASSTISGLPNMSVEELVRIGRYPYTNLFGVLRENDFAIINQAIRFCGLEYHKNTALNQLSDGERQRAALARVFAQDTGIMLLDEPTSFLDIPNKFEIFDLLRDLSEKGKTIIFTTHDLNLASLYADKIWLIHENSIVSGAPEDLYLGSELRAQFATKKLTMNQNTGEFMPSRPTGKKIYLSIDKGCENAGLWTHKALFRKGYFAERVQDSTAIGSAIIEIYKEKDKFVWNLRRDKQNLLNTSIYELILNLENN